MNWYCLCGNYVKERRFCPRCKLMRFKLERPVLLDYFHLNLGTTYGQIPFNLPLNRIAQHVLISGQTGTGKSRFAMNLAIKAENYAQIKKTRLLVIDIEGEWKGIIPHLKEKTVYYDVAKNLRINPFDLNDAGIVKELLRETVFKGIEKEYSDLSAQMNFVLNDAISKSKNIAELVTNIKNYQDHKLSSLDRTKTALMVRLDPFMHSPLKEIFMCKRSTIDFEHIDEYNFIIDLHALDAKVAYSTELRLIYNTITSYYLRRMLDRESRQGLSNLFIADEAQKLVPKILHKLIITESWSATEFATRLRKRGCGIVLITQSPVNIEPDIVKNCGVRVSFRLQHPDDIKLIADSCGFVEPTEFQYLVEKFVRLSNKNAIVSTTNFEPFLITASDYQPTNYEPNITTLNEESQSIMDKNKHENLSVEEKIFLSSIETNPFLSVRDRRSLLRMDSKKYTKIVEHILKEGIIEKIGVKIGKGKPLSLYQKRGTIPGIRHEYYVNWIKTKLEELGYKIKTNKKDGPDIVIPQIKTAIEVESGKSAMFSNVERDIHKFDFVIMCSDDNKVIERLSLQTKNPKVLVSKIQDVPVLIKRAHH